MLGAWIASSSAEESREFHQRRLALLAKILCGSFATLMVAMYGIYAVAPHVKPQRQAEISVVALVGLTVVGAVWGLLVRRPLTARMLVAMDALLVVGAGCVFASSAYLSPELATPQYINLTWHCIVIFLRTIVVPSTGRRTAMISAAAMVPMVLAAVGVSLQAETELGPVAFISGTVFVGLAVVLLATVGSLTVYGLRKQVREAMQLGQYTLERKIGEGGMGVVYLGHHALLRRPTAIKTLLPERVGPEAITRFEHEVQHMARLTHPNTVAVFDYGRSVEGVFYYAMEYLDGGIDLERLVANYGALPPGRVISLLVQVCRALTEAHDKGIIHRDIKPANIVVCERGGEPDVVKVLDYGLAREVDAGEQPSTKRVLGTPAYMAPETITGDEPVGPAADLYAVGAVGYYLLAGHRVFDGKTALDVCVQHVTRMPEPPSRRGADVPVELEAIIMSCLAKSVGERPKSAAQLGRSLQALGTSGWSDDEARTWWRQHSRELERLTSVSATVTLAIDLGERAHAHQPKSANHHS